MSLTTVKNRYGKEIHLTDKQLEVRTKCLAYSGKLRGAASKSGVDLAAIGRYIIGKGNIVEFQIDCLMEVIDK